ncbi:uncharacterized protein LOC124607384 [Schistocerca americana]|nr:uncharacterized protein LOC124607384 [Schistocerca americana]
MFLAVCRSSVDLNMAELQHVADHLNKRECRRLMAALRSPSRDLPSKSQLELAERQVPQTDHCIDLLLRWNSGSGRHGARGRSGMEPLSRRLRQLGHPHLASWLSKSVFHALAQDLGDDVAALNSDGDTVAMAAAKASPNKIRHLRTEQSEEVSDEVQWMPLDTVLCAAVVALAVTALMLLAVSTWRYCRVCSDASSQNRYNVLRDTEEESTDTNVWNPTAEEVHHPMTPYRSGTSHPLY